MIYRKKPDELPRYHAQPVLDAMGRCRKALIEANMHVTPFGPAYKAIRLVIVAIDDLATHLTGNDQFYHVGASTGSDAGRWRDSGS